MEVLQYGYRIPFLCDPPLSEAPISMPSYHPSSTKGGGAEGSYSGPCGQVRSGTSSPAFSWPLQPAVCCLEDLRVLETRHRSLDPQFVCGRSSLPHGDHPVCTAVSSSGRLDGLHRPQISLPAGPCPSRLSSLPSVCSSGQCLPVLCPLLQAIHSSSGLHSGHGSCFCHSPLLRYLHEAVPRRLASPVLISRLSPSRSPGSSESLPRAGASSQSREVSPCSISGGAVPWSRDRLPVFPGFSIFGAHRQASVNRRRISILHRSARQYLALASRHAVLSLPSGARWTSEGEVSSALSLQAVGSGRSVCPDSLVSGLPQGSSVVARPSSSVSRGVSRSDLPRSRLLVRRLGRGLRCSPRFSDRFRPLGSGSGSSLHQRSRAPGCAGGSPPFSAFSSRESSFHLLRQQHSGVLSPQRGRHEISISKLSHSGDPALGGVPLHPPLASVHSGVAERPSGLTLSSSPAPSYRMVPSPRGFSLYQSSLAGVNRLVCHVRQSPMFCFFLSLPGSDGGGHGRLPPVLGRASSLRLPSVVCYSPSVGEAPRVSGVGAHSDRPLLSSAPLVSRPPSPVAGPSAATSCTCLSLPAFTRVSKGFGFMPGDSQALHEGCRILLCCSRSGFLVATPILAQGLPAEVASLSSVVPLSWTFFFQSIFGEGGGFSLLAPLFEAPRGLFHQGLPIYAVSCFSFSATFSLFSSCASRSPSLFCSGVRNPPASSSCVGPHLGSEVSYLLHLRAAC